jgi:carnitine-CoA ligase
MSSGPELPALHPFVGQDLNTALAERAIRRAGHPFIISSPPDAEETQLTYSEFQYAVSRAAAGFSSRGIGEGNRVLIMLQNCPELLIAFFACAHLGAVAVTINTRSVSDEVAYYANHSRAKLVVTEPAFVDVVRSACPQIDLVWIGHDDGTRPHCIAGTTRFVDLGANRPEVAPASINPGRDLCVQYTSGTTARPKGVVWTHANALWGGHINARHTGLRPDDVYLTHLPLYHTNALAYSALGTFWAGSTMVLLAKFSARRFWPISLRHRCTVTSIIPFVVRAIADQPVPADHSYRTWGSPICDPPSDRHFGVKSVGWWGMTETVSHGIVGDPDQSNTALSCGRPAPEYQLRIIDETGVDVTPGETGALRIAGVRGVSIFSRYLDDDTATAEAFDSDGYFVTGDRVTLLADGHIRFADRDNDMLKVGGENVAASEVERVVMSVPGVAEVAVVAWPDPMLFEVPVAFVIPVPNADSFDLAAAILRACATNLADFKVPRRVVLVSELPRATLNKVAKSVLRERLRSELARDGDVL